jgi:hypothetical protein
MPARVASPSTASRHWAKNARRSCEGITSSSRTMTCSWKQIYSPFNNYSPSSQVQNLQLLGTTPTLFPKLSQLGLRNEQNVQIVHTFSITYRYILCYSIASPIWSQRLQLMQLVHWIFHHTKPTEEMHTDWCQLFYLLTHHHHVELDAWIEK